MFMGALQCVFFRSPLSVNGEGVGGGVRPRNELLQALLEHGALEHDAPAAGETAQADVGAEAVDLPVVAAARVHLAQPDHVIEANLEDRG
jgi:hypothetical protein